MPQRSRRSKASGMRVQCLRAARRRELASKKQTLESVWYIVHQNQGEGHRIASKKQTLESVWYGNHRRGRGRGQREPQRSRRSKASGMEIIGEGVDEDNASLKEADARKRLVSTNGGGLRGGVGRSLKEADARKRLVSPYLRKGRSDEWEPQRSRRSKASGMWGRARSESRRRGYLKEADARKRLVSGSRSAPRPPG